MSYLIKDGSRVTFLDQVTGLETGQIYVQISTVKSSDTKAKKGVYGPLVPKVQSTISGPRIHAQQALQYEMNKHQITEALEIGQLVILGAQPPLVVTSAYFGPGGFLTYEKPAERASEAVAEDARVWVDGQWQPLTTVLPTENRWYLVWDQNAFRWIRRSETDLECFSAVEVIETDFQARRALLEQKVWRVVRP